MTCWLCGFETTELATNPKAPICKNDPCQICIAVANLDEEINQAAAALRRLLAKRCHLRSEQNRVHETLVHRLPAELTNDIFERLLPLRDEWGRFPTRRPITVMPLYLASICRSWRDIAWSNPLLWSTIRIVVGREDSTSGRIKFVHDWILRSRTLPLTLHIDVCNREGSEDELKGVIHAITQCSDRWHSLSLDVPPELLPAFHLTDSQCHLLKRLRIDSRSLIPNGSVLPFLRLNPTASPEKIELSRVSFQPLQMSWNHLASAKVEGLDLEGIAHLFRHASQMTYCHISSPHCPADFSMAPIVHQRLETLRLDHVYYYHMAHFLGSLTLPSLQEFRTNEMGLLTPPFLPMLVHLSSCPLTSITLNSDTYGGGWGGSVGLHPFPGVSDLVLETVYDHTVIQNILLEPTFPNLRHLTLRLQPFLFMWTEGIIPLLLDRKRRPDAPSEGRLLKLLVIDQDHFLQFDEIWKSDAGEQLKALNISLREDGFEFL